MKRETVINLTVTCKDVRTFFTTVGFPLHHVLTTVEIENRSRADSSVCHHLLCSSLTLYLVVSIRSERART